MKIKAEVSLQYNTSYYGYNDLSMRIYFYLPQKRFWGTKRVKTTLNKMLVCKSKYKDDINSEYKFLNDILAILRRESDEELIRIAKNKINEYFESLSSDNKNYRMLNEIKNLLKNDKPIQIEVEIKE